MITDQVIFRNNQWEGFDRLKVPGGDYQLLLVFAEKSLLTDASIHNKLRDHFPAAKIVASSTAGEITGRESLENAALVIALKLEQTPFKVVYQNISTAKDSHDLGIVLARQLAAEDLSYVMIISDGHDVNGSDLLNGIKSELGETLPMSGGMAGDGNLFSSTLVGVDGDIKNGHVALIGFYGDALRVCIDVQRGFNYFGPERKVTRSNKNVLYDIDGTNALELYKKYLGEYAAELPSSALLFPVAILNDNDEPLVRTILSINEADGSMVFAGNMPEGVAIRFMRSNLDQLIQKAEDASRLVTDCIEEPDLMLVMNCVGRKIILGQRRGEEIEALTKSVSKETVIAGFYTYGEFSSWEKPEKTCDLHNQTVVVTALKEDIRVPSTDQ
ncbi:MAG: hypothetical protein RLZ76_1748 [Bacteroidota bacterium]|jgi:hypothetical protein